MTDLEIRVKALSYKFISLGCDIYKNDKIDELLLIRHSCSDCKTSWYMNLTECFFCGCINSYLYFCNKCKVYSSTTGGKKKCSRCGEDRKKNCFNEKCITNNIKFQEELNKPKNGVLDRGSPSSVSQTHCIKCGSECNEYLTKLVKIINVTSTSNIKFDKNFNNYDSIIFIKNNEKKYLILNNEKEFKNLKNFENEIKIDKIF